MFTLNGQDISLTTNPARTLLNVLREDLKLKGAKKGCGEGECGACAILMDKKLVNSCILPIGLVNGKNILTIEGFRKTKRFQVLQESFENAGSVQCGFCTPGMIMAAEALLCKNSDPNDQEIRDAISGNLCRCTGYNMIIDGIKLAAQVGKGLW